MSILNGEFALEVAAALESVSVPYALTLTRWVVPSSPAYPEWDPPPPVEVQYPCRGFTDQYDASYRAGGLIEAGDVKVVIVATSIEVEPQPGDTITARGKTYSAVSVEADPALATYQVQARP